LAIDEINADGGVKVGGKKMTFKWSRSTINTVRPIRWTNAKQLVQQNNAAIRLLPAFGRHSRNRSVQ